MRWILVEIFTHSFIHSVKIFFPWVTDGDRVVSGFGVYIKGLAKSQSSLTRWG
jgi:hypothetical protein